MWINATIAAATSLVASATRGVTKVSLSNEPVLASTVWKHDKHKVSTGFFDDSSSEFGQQIGLDWNPKQPATDTLWENYVEKGNHFECLMSASEKGAQNLIVGDTPVKSPWTGTLQDDLKKWYWHEGYVETDIECDFKRLYLQEVFDGLGLDPRPGLDEREEPTDGANICHKLHHFNEELRDENGEETDILRQTYVVDETTRYATGAHYNFGINSGGAIIGMDLVGPRYAVTERHNWNREADPDELPKLRYISDIFWGFYLRSNPSPEKLRYYIATHVLNDVTVALVARALSNVGAKDLSEWPGNSFELGSEELSALVGSPIGGSIAALLFQHKAELGLKHIVKVTVVYDSNQDIDRRGNRLRPWLYIVYHIEGVSPDEEQMPKTQNLDERSIYFEAINLSAHPGGATNHPIRLHTIV